MKKLLPIIFLLSLPFSQRASNIDSLFKQWTKKLEWARGFRFNGYAQVQFQYAQEPGAKSYAAGNFDSLVNTRFSIRRGRMIPTYEYEDPKTGITRLHFSIQADFTERGVQLMHAYGRFREPFFNVLSIQGGLFNRPFGFEIGYTSRNRETPERGRMSQKLFPQERDLGGMIILEAPPKSKWNFFRLEAGVFNGMGLTPEVDKRKDFVGKLSLFHTFQLDTLKINQLNVSVGGSFLQSGTLHMNKDAYSWSVLDSTGLQGWLKSTDTSRIKTGYAAKQFWGVDMQIRFIHRINQKLGYSSEWRAELIGGKQSGTAKSSDSFRSLNRDPLYTRSFLGGYFYWVNALLLPKGMEIQVVGKYDFYDPNTAVSGKSIGANPIAGILETDIRYETFEVALNYIYNEHWKIMIAYAIPRNERTSLTGFDRDIRDNVLTTRLQFAF